MRIIFPNIKIERWKYNKTYEVYVSNMGHFRNKSGANIAPYTTTGGYLSVLCLGSVPHFVLAHRLVMLTWRPTPEAEELTVDHLDHNKHNNSLDNLEWVSKEENQKRAKDDFLNGKKVYDLMLADARKKVDNTVGKRVVMFSAKEDGRRPCYIEPDLIGLREAIDTFSDPSNKAAVDAITTEVKKLFNGVNTSCRKKVYGVQLFLVQEEIYDCDC